MLTRCVGLLVNSSNKMQTLQVRSMSPNPLDGIEHFESYGFTSNPHPGFEGILAALGSHRSNTICLVAADRRYRVTGLLTGEVAIHDDLGQSIILHRDRIEITAPQGLEIIGDVNVTGDVIANGISLVNHTHGGVEPGGGNTGAPQ
ncbi:MAG: phage baseplate assembly protein [Gammaproteobacteria bacterium]|nr:phage baseplate assembly protein [Gammaproteobacteria bacterium]